VVVSGEVVAVAEVDTEADEVGSGDVVVNDVVVERVRVWIFVVVVEWLSVVETDDDVELEGSVLWLVLENA
jgi:hypothetical protein